MSTARVVIAVLAVVSLTVGAAGSTRAAAPARGAQLAFASEEHASLGQSRGRYELRLGEAVRLLDGAAQ
jgi:hypothetical protein